MNEAAPQDGPEAPVDRAAKARDKKARRKAQAAAERAAGRALDVVASQAVDAAMALAPEVADAQTRKASERVLDVEFETLDAARYAVKRINEALTIGEWLDDVEVWVWQANIHTREPMTDHGRANGIELRMEHPTTRPV